MKQKMTNKEDKKNSSWNKQESQGIVGSDSNLYTEHGEMWLVL